jgi:hypothetical protein
VKLPTLTALPVVKLMVNKVETLLLFVTAKVELSAVISISPVPSKLTPKSQTSCKPPSLGGLCMYNLSCSKSISNIVVVAPATLFVYATAPILD